MEVTKQHVVDVLRTAGLPEAAAEADRSLPEQMELERAEEFLGPYGITKDVLISRSFSGPTASRRMC